MNFINKKFFKLLNLFLGIALFVIVIPGCLNSFQSIAENNSPITQNTTNTTTIAKNTNCLIASKTSLGIGLNGITDWSTQFPFIDHFKTSRKWITQCIKTDPGCDKQWNTKEFDLLDLDQAGWLKSLPKPTDAPIYTRVSTLLFRDVPAGQFPAGKYVVLYEGEGTLEYGFIAKKIEAESIPGRDVLEVDGEKSQGILLTITNTDPNKTGNYLRNIRVIQADQEALYEQGEIFNPLFLEKIKPFRALRFMDWMQTNGSSQKNWSDRPYPESASYAWNGSPIEVMVSLVNKLNADAWLNIPHQATDEYIKNFAQLVKDQLAPNLKVYLELSNEVWNWQFSQAHYALEQAEKRWGKEQDIYMQWYGMRTAQMCDIWKSVWSKEKDRVVCVISSQTARHGLENKALDCPKWVAEGNKPCVEHGISAYGITGYFDGRLGRENNTSIVESWLDEADGGFNQAFTHLRQGGLLTDSQGIQDTYKHFTYYADVAKQRNLQLVAYEGGQHIVGVKKVVNNERLTNFFIELNRQPKMYDLYTELLETWEKSGGTLFMHFVDVAKPSKWGSWGALEYLGQDGSPKYNALIDFVNRK
jgi:hypothetical protein